MNLVLKQYLSSLLVLIALYTGGIAQAATHHDVNITNFQFTPDDVSVADGDTVIWHWALGFHSTTSNAGVTPAWDSGQKSSGTFTVVFPSASGNGPWAYHCTVHGLGMAGTIRRTTLGVDVIQDNSLPKNFSVEQNYPNPFNPTTNIRYSLDKASSVEFSVYNILGQVVEFKYLGNQPAGSYNLTWNGASKDGSSLPSGIYYYRLKAGDFTDTKKMLLLK